jgi:dTDP-4-amino-4,6-dideoxygalactose transaminase
MSTVAEPTVIELGAPILGNAEKQALTEVIDSGWLTMGHRVRQFELAFAELHGVADAVAVHSATAALQLMLAAFDIGPGDEVLVPSLSFVATASVVVHAGARPVFVDIDAVDRPHMSVGDARRCITPRTRAITVMHYGGYGMDLAPWRALADEFGLFLFEDAAHAAGLVGRVGVHTDAAAFSFFPNKNMTTAEGGMLVVRDEARRSQARLLRSHGMTASTLDRDRGRSAGYDVVGCGHNYRMDELRGALGVVQLARLPGWNDVRRDLTLRYRDRLATELPQVLVPFDAAHPTTAHILPVLLPPGTDRTAVMAGMRKTGVQTSMHYPPIHRFAFYLRTFGEIAVPVTEAFCARQLTLPLHPRLSDADVDRVVRSLGTTLDAHRQLREI